MATTRAVATERASAGGLPLQIADRMGEAIIVAAPLGEVSVTFLNVLARAPGSVIPVDR